MPGMGEHLFRGAAVGCGPAPLVGDDRGAQGAAALRRHQRPEEARVPDQSAPLRRLPRARAQRESWSRARHPDCSGLW